jgi:carbon storage regulator CsrA
MLILSRKIGEEIVIDGGITVRITRIVGNRVSLAVSAPLEVGIVRGELPRQAAGVERPGPDEDLNTRIKPRSSRPGLADRVHALRASSRGEALDAVRRLTEVASIP